MDHAARTPEFDDTAPDAVDDARRAERVTILIRAAKLISGQGEFVCVIRDVSEVGISVRMFHKLPSCETMELHMPSGAIYEIRSVWERGNEAGFEFTHSVDVAKLIDEAGEYPKRGMRLNMYFPVEVATLAGKYEAFVENLSQQGARLECDGLFAIDQTVTLVGEGLKEVRAKVRWRRDNHYGVVFDDTYTLGEFARLAAELQAPVLLDHG